MRDIFSFDLFDNPKRRAFVRRLRGRPLRFAVMERKPNGLEKIFGECLNFADAKALLLKVRQQQCH
jgi:hypothetical protein